MIVTNLIIAGVIILNVIALYNYRADNQELARKQSPEIVIRCDGGDCSSVEYECRGTADEVYKCVKDTRYQGVQK